MKTEDLPQWAIDEGFTIELDSNDMGASLLLGGQVVTSITSIFGHWRERVYEFQLYLDGYRAGMMNYS